MIVNTVAILKTLACPGVIDLLGYFAPGDGGGGRFYFDIGSTTPDDGGTVFAPTPGGGRWKRIYSGPVHVDWFGANTTDATAAFVAASAFPHIEAFPRSYMMNGQLSIQAGQVWDMKGALIWHNDNTKVMFSAVGVSHWLFEHARLVGTLTSAGMTGEKGLYIEGCNRYRARAVTAELFRGQGIHIAPGTFAGFKGDQGQFTDCATNENMVGVQIDNGSGAEYNTFSNHNASGNKIGVEVGAGNTTFSGGSICQNATGVYLSGGTNNGHGIFSGVNINHNTTCNVWAYGVTNGFTFQGCHVYGDGVPDPETGALSGRVLIENNSTDINFVGGVLDAAIVNNSGTNRVTNAKKYSQFSVAGSNSSGLIQSGNF